MLKKVISFALAVVLVVALCTPGLASSLSRQINVNYGISIYFNKEKQDLTDAAGNPVAPFAYNGTTYVPIRAVSDLFGADVIYDPETNGAYIYDDYAETYAIANRMQTTIADCYMLIQLEATNILTDKLDDLSAAYEECAGEVSAIYALMESIGEDNPAVGGLIDDTLQVFTDFAVSFADAHHKYDAVRNSQTNYNANQFADAYDLVINQYYAARNDISTYFEQYCWRDMDAMIAAG